VREKESEESRKLNNCWKVRAKLCDDIIIIIAIMYSYFAHFHSLFIVSVLKRDQELKERDKNITQKREMEEAGGTSKGKENVLKWMDLIYATIVKTILFILLGSRNI